MPQNSNRIASFLAKKQHYALYSVIIIWSFSPLVVRGISTTPKSNSGGWHPTFGASLAVVISAAMSLIWMRQRSRKDYDEAKACLFDHLTWDTVKLVGLGILAFVAYPLCYFNGLHSNIPIGVNIVNYAWPLVLVITRLAFYPRRSTMWVIVGILTSSLGALVATGNVTGFKHLLFESVPLDESSSVIKFHSIEFEHLKPYLFAIGCALFYGVYSALVSEVRPKLKDGTQISDKARFLVMLISAGVLHILLQVTILCFVTPDIAPKTVASIFSEQSIWLLVYAALNLSVGHLLWIYVRSEESAGRADFPSAPAIYFTFVLGTLILSLNSGSETLNADLLWGTALVLSGIYVSATETAISPFAAFALVVVLAYGLSAYLRPLPGVAGVKPPQDTDLFYLSFLESVTGIFAILSGFILSRVHSRSNEVRRLYLGILEALRQLARSAKSSISLTDKFQNFGIQVIELQLARTLPDANLTVSLKNKPPNQLLIYDAGIDKTIETDVTDAVQHERVENLLSEVRSKSREWSSFDFDSVSWYERIALLGLVLSMLLLLFHVPVYETVFISVRAFFAATLIVILAAIEDYQRGRIGHVKKTMELGRDIFDMQDKTTETELDLYTRKQAIMARCFVSLVALLIVMYSIKRILPT